MQNDIVNKRHHTSHPDLRPEPNDADAPLVVFIAGAGRSGSTLLGDSLGQLPHCFHAGEMRFVLEQQLDTGDRICGCGRPLNECELWLAIRSRAFGTGSPSFDLDELARFSKTELGYRPRSWLKLRRQAHLSDPLGLAAKHYTLALRQLYLAICAETNSTVVIDSSKAAMHVHLGSRFAGVRAHVLHLVRDPRAIAYSWRRRHIDGTITYGPTRVSVNWVASNIAVEALADHVAKTRYTFMRYEDFIRNPKAVLENLTCQIGVDSSSSPFVDATTLRMGPNHTVAGNPSRFKSGDVTLAPDDEWQLLMSTRDRTLATLPAAVLLKRYAYPLRVS